MTRDGASERQVYRAADFPDELLELVASVEPPDEAKAFDYEVDKPNADVGALLDSRERLQAC